MPSAFIVNQNINGDLGYVMNLFLNNNIACVKSSLRKTKDYPNKYVFCYITYFHDRKKRSLICSLIYFAEI